MIKAGTVGFTGYAGGELARLLPQRDDTEIKWHGSGGYIDQKYASIYRNTLRIVNDACIDDNMKELADQVDVVFTATLQGLCVSLMGENVLFKIKVIDLSADLRIKDVSVYKEWYKLTHASPRFIGEAVHGSPEINWGEAKGVRLVANPGYFPTCSFLPTYPLVKGGFIDSDTVIVDAKSGISGAGRGSKVDSLYCEINGNIKAYRVASHRYTPEIEEQLSCTVGKPITISFIPHLVLINRGVLVTTYVSLTKRVSYEEVRAAHDKYYRNEYFVHVLEKDVVLQIRWVEGSNLADVNFKMDTRTNRVMIMGTIDSMVRGAAGQVIQSVNLIFGLPENTGLKQIPTFL